MILVRQIQQVFHVAAQRKSQEVTWRDLNSQTRLWLDRFTLLLWLLQVCPLFASESEGTKSSERPKPDFFRCSFRKGNW